MGMSSSQVRLLQLTSRKNTIGRELSSLSLQKNALSRDMKKVSLAYQDALSTKSLKWTNNSGASYVDLSYKNLMTPNAYNGKQPYLITNSSGKVVVDSTYSKYAQMISPDGSPVSDWSEQRAEILSALTGISIDKIQNAENTSILLSDSEEKINKLQEEADKALAKCTNSSSAVDFMKLFGDVPSKFDWWQAGPINLGNGYEDGGKSTNGSYSLLLNTTSPNEAKTLIDELFDTFKNNAQNYLTDDNYKHFSQACEDTKAQYHDFIDTFESGYAACGSDKSSLLNRYDTEVSKRTETGDPNLNDGKFYLRMQNLMNNLLANYEKNGGESRTNSLNTSIIYYSTVDRTSENYQDYVAKQAEVDAAKSEYAQLVDNNNQILTADEERQIAFYDKLFNAIAENGWYADSNVEDGNYLNQMMQNNQYYITTINTYQDDDGEDYYEYDTNIASNFEYIVSVNDTAVQTEAQAKYEYEKSIINEKESRIDTRMQDLETEQSSINEMIKGIESVRNNNIERTFSIFS